MARRVVCVRSRGLSLGQNQKTQTAANTSSPHKTPRPRAPFSVNSRKTESLRKPHAHCPSGGHPRQPASVRGVPARGAGDAAPSGCAARRLCRLRRRSGVGARQASWSWSPSGALAVRGNHDDAVNDREPAQCRGAVRHRMDARRSSAWTERRFLAELPLTVQRRGPALRSCRRQRPEQLALCLDRGGCLAQPELRRRRRSPFAATCTGRRSTPSATAAKMTAFSPVTGVAVQLHARAAGSRCSARSASRATAIRPRPTPCFDDHKKEITFCRAPYDVEAAAAAIRKAGLPLLLRRPAVGREVRHGQAAR